MQFNRANQRLNNLAYKRPDLPAERTHSTNSIPRSYGGSHPVRPPAATYYNKPSIPDVMGNRYHPELSRERDLSSFYHLSTKKKTNHTNSDFIHPTLSGKLLPETFRTLSDTEGCISVKLLTLLSGYEMYLLVLDAGIGIAVARGSIPVELVGCIKSELV